MADAIYIGDMSPRKAPPSKRACPNQDIVDMLLVHWPRGIECLSHN